MEIKKFDLVVVGAGIVGLATAREWQIRHPSHRVAVLDKESGVARHQTGHNSGVIHAGVYYKPGSLKASLCVSGRKLLLDFLKLHQIPHELCGKLIVATCAAELPALQALYERGMANGLQGMERLSQARLQEEEPGVAGVEGILVPETGIVDYREVCSALAEEIKARNGTVFLGHKVTRIEERDGAIAIQATTDRIKQDFEAGYLINCGGLQSDLIARLAGVDPEVRIIPFRGEYYLIPQEKTSIRLKHLIYPVPDPDFPFLGVHFTKDLKGNIECGPNAVLAWSREGYSRWQYSLSEALSILSFPGTRIFARKHLAMGISEWRRSISRRRFGDSLRTLFPGIQDAILESAPAGVRAQAMRPNGALVDDFWIRSTKFSTHVLNAPSPAATASLAIAREIVSRSLSESTGPAI